MPLTYTSVVVEGPNQTRHWATSDAGGGFMGVRFRGDGPPVEVPLRSWGLYLDFMIARDGRRVAAVKRADGPGVWIVTDAGAVLPVIDLQGVPQDTAGNWAHAFGPGDRLYLQQDNSDVLHVYGLDGTPDMTVEVDAAGSRFAPLRVPMLYDSASGIHHIAPDGTPVPGVAVRADRTVAGVTLSFPEEMTGFAAGQAGVGLLGGVVLVNTATGDRRMWPTYTPHRARLSVIAGQPYVSICCESAPAPDSTAAWPAYEPLPPVRVAGSRRPRWMVAVSDGVVQGPGHIHWSYTDGAKPHVEGGPWAWRDFFNGHPPAIVIHDLRDGIDDLTVYPLDWPKPPAEHIVREETVDGVVTRRWAGSMKRLAQLSGARLACYHDANKALALLDYGEDGQPSVTDIPLEAFRHVQLVRALREEGIDALIGHQGYPVMKGNVCLDAFDAVWRTEHWGLEIYARAGLPVMLWVPIFCGNPVGPDGHDAYPIGTIAQLHHFQTALVDRYPGVEVVAAFDWVRPSGQQKYPWLRAAWQDVVTQTPRPAIALPAVRAYQPPAPPAPVPVPDEVPAAPSADGGRGGASAGPSKPMTKKQKQIAVAAAAGGGLFAILSKIFHWW